MRVLFVVPGAVTSASARYRCGHLAAALALRGHTAEVFSATENTTIRVNHDILVLHRMGDGGTGERLITAARSIGAAVVYGADDLIFEPEYAFQVGLAHPDDPVRYHYHRGEGAAARRCLLQADAALVSTEFLAARTRHLFAIEGVSNRPATVLRNVVSPEILTRSAEARERRTVGFGGSHRGEAVVLGYLSGSPTHDADLAGIAPAVAAALERHPEARLLVVGPVALPPPLRPWADQGRVARHPFVPWEDLPALLAGIDINLAPLDSSRVFNHAKSEVKWLEAGAVGIPTLADAAVGFEEGVRADIPPADCVLVRRREDWPAALDRLIGEPDLRAQVGDAARAAVEARGTVEAATDAIEHAFLAFAALGRRAPDASTGVTVRQPWGERLERRFRAVEEGFIRRGLRWRRHVLLVAGE